ncbi:cecropin-B1-like [Trichoplusia ni]|uniref:Cecropin-B1-like n=1 Tax=Trichoplusia ni TaxID=7111 RepID=A0A7E5W0S3_TRINI|nr:cecropin-B1-like [Trichoplusia ni]
MKVQFECHLSQYTQLSFNMNFYKLFFVVVLALTMLMSTQAEPNPEPKIKWGKVLKNGVKVAKIGAKVAGAVGTGIKVASAIGALAG